MKALRSGPGAPVWKPLKLFVATSLALACAFGAGGPARAEEPDAPRADSSAPAPATAPVLEIPEAARATPGFDVERATEAWLATVPAEARARSDAYFEGGYWLQLVGWLWLLAATWLMLAGGRARRVRDALERRLRRRFLANVATGAIYLLTLSILTLPFDLWTGYFREHAYGLSNQDLGGWFGDWGKGLAVGLLLGSLAIAGIYGVVRRAGRSWWLWGSGVAVAFLIFGIAIAPVYIAPLFNRYQRLEAGPLRDQVLSLARSYRVPATDVWWFDASRQTKRVSANVSGFLGTTRISLNDNLLRRSPRETILAVLGHEMGHYVLGHVRTGILSFGLLVAAGFAFVHFTFERLSRRRPSWALAGVADPAGLPLAVALISTFFFIATPVSNTIIRTSEAEADAFGLAAAREPDGFAHAAVQLAEYRKMHPGPLEEIIFFDHPSGYNRIRRAMIWKAENLAECATRERAAGAP
jgi:STE24 endopeptidase